MTPIQSPTLASQATAELPKPIELPKLPEPYSVKSTIKCTACGAPYSPPMTLAGGAAQWPGRLLPPHACRCGNTQFGGTVSGESLSPAQFTADQMNAHYLAGYEAGRASRAQSEWISVEDRVPEVIGDEDTPVWSWDGQQVREDNYCTEWDQPAGPMVGGWVRIGQNFDSSAHGATVTHWTPRTPPNPPTPPATTGETK